MQQHEGSIFYVCTDGSLGDALPMVRIAAALRDDGRRVAVIANDRYQTLVESSGAEFIRWSGNDALERFWDDPRTWDRRAGFQHYVKNWVSAVTPALVELLRAACTPETTVVAQTMALGARIARELLPFRLVTVHLQPAFLRSRFAVPVMPFVNRSIRVPPLGAAVFYAVIDLFADRAFGPIGAIRRAHGLPPVRRYLHRWIHSPDLSIATFPEWFARPQADWPSTVRRTGFILPQTTPGALDETVSEFLTRNRAPALVALGSAQKHARGLYGTIVSALRARGNSLIVCAPFGEDPAANDPGVLFSRFIPFETLLPRCGAFIHHGGIGSTACGFTQGIPQLALPMAHDQFDNGARIASLGCGRSLPARRARPIDIMQFMEAVVKGSFAQGCAAARSRMDSHAWMDATIRRITGADR